MPSALARSLVAAALAAAAAGCPRAPAPPAGLIADAPPPATADAASPAAPPLGATIDPAAGTVTFRVASTRATRMEVWIYAAPTGAAARHAPLARGADGVWQAQLGLADLAAAGVTTIYYGYRAWGPNWADDAAWTPGSDAGFVARVDADGDRMDPNKLLIDPYAQELSHDPWGPMVPDGSIYATDPAHRDVDSGPWAPKSIALPPMALDVGPRPTRALRDDVVMEVHLRGLTAADDPTADPCRGTYAAAATRAAELAALGVTAVEFMPLAETPNDGNDVDPTSDAGDNYWGYSQLAFFAPDRRYACDRSPGGPTRELAAMVRAFHQAGLEVFVDVVYNHTAEGGGGSLLSWRGLDNAAYYELDDAGTGFADQTGIGASMNATSPLYRDLVIDSLRAWHERLGVDGFRFDLAPVMANGCARGCYKFDPGDPGGVLLRAAAELPARPADGGDGVALIAEPWGVADGTYQVGHFPLGWSEWNDQFRDLVREDQNQLGTAAVTMGWLADRITGSPDLFAPRGPVGSIDYLDSHDGMTLADLYRCNGKNNAQPWPYGPSNGGTNDDHAWDHGGDAAAQRQAARTGLALVMLSAGVPMIQGGDEALRSQRCNNNAYNLDSIATWLDPADRTRNAAFVTFAQRMMQFRAAHAALRPRGWYDAGSIAWRKADGTPAAGAWMDDPNNQVLAWRLDGAALGDAARAIFVAYDGGTAAAAITLPPHAADTRWWRVADTGAWMEAQANSAAPGSEAMMNGDRYDLNPRSLALFIER